RDRAPARPRAAQEPPGSHRRRRRRGLPRGHPRFHVLRAGGGRARGEGGRGEEGSEVSMRVPTHVREDALALCGFLTAHEQDLFERLIQVAGVGPRLAVNILSGIEAAELAAALRGSDIARLTRVPGVGKKTAERLVVELKDKMPPVAGPEAEEGGGPG